MAASKFYSNIYKDGRAFSLAALAKSTDETVLYAGDPALNWCIGGGWSLNRINLMYGPSRSGKSFLAVMGAAKAQKKKQDGDVVIFDSEYYYTDPKVAERAAIAGLNLDNTHVVSSNRLQTLFGRLNSLEDDLKAKTINLAAIVIDSLGGIQSDLAESKMEKGKADEAGNAGRGNAKYINPILGVLLRLSAEYGVTTFIVQHCIMNQEEYGAPYKLIGGQRLQLLSHTVLFVEGSTAQDSILLAGDQRVGVDIAKEQARGHEMIGKKILARCEKSRNTTENKKSEFFINFKEMRFARSEESLFNLACNLGVITHPIKEDGKENIAYWEFRLGDSAPAKFHGSGNTIEALKDRELFRKVFEECKLSSKTDATNEQLSGTSLSDDWNV